MDNFIQKYQPHISIMRKLLKKIIPKNWINAYYNRRSKTAYYRAKLHTISECAQILHEQTKIPYSVLVKDMQDCLRRYPATGLEYFQYGFHLLNDFARDSFLTEKRTRVIDLKLNPEEFRHIYKQKTVFAEYFKDYLKRRWIFAPQADARQIAHFVEELGSVIVKPSSGRQGQGIYKTSLGDIPDMQEFCRKTVQEQSMIEEIVQQHPVLNSLNPRALSTVRIVTLLDTQGHPCIFASALRIATQHDSVVDNMSAGGMVAQIDSATGIVTTQGIDSRLALYPLHPLTGKTVSGLHIPFWEDAKEMTLKAALVVPQLRYTGWDVAITENGPLLIEGNCQPCETVVQLPSQTGLYHKLIDMSGLRIPHRTTI